MMIWWMGFVSDMFHHDPNKIYKKSQNSEYLMQLFL